MRVRRDMSDLVQRPTGWPRQACRDLVRVLQRRHWATAMLLPVLAGISFFFAWNYGYAAMLEFFQQRGDNLGGWIRQAIWWRMPLVVAGGLGVAGVGGVLIGKWLSRVTLRRHVDRFLAGPTCLSCRYPLAPGAGPCPECGEPPPSHLVEWVAKTR